VEWKDLKEKECWKLIGVLVGIFIGVVGVFALLWWLIITKGIHP